MKIAVVGTGYVGLVSGACLAEMGNQVICMDKDLHKISRLKNCVLPIYEPGLESMVNHNQEKMRLFFTHDYREAFSSTDIIIICVGTPARNDGTADLGSVYETAREIGKYITAYTVVVTKSTVPVGTTMKVRELIEKELTGRSLNLSFDMVNNPEFLKEGNAIADFMTPDRIVIGTNSEKAKKIMQRLYSAFFRTDQRIIFISVESSDLTKYASNSMLATRISFMNEIALLAEKVGANIEEIRQGIAHDKRIGKFFLYSGAGYGGSCFPKDISALIQTGRENGCEMNIIRAVNEVNNRQKIIVSEKILRFFNFDVRNKKIAIWGLAFKPETDDVRDAPALETAQKLREHGARLSVHDPVARENARSVLGDESIMYHNDSYEALKGAEALVVMTEWKEYRTPDWKRIRELMSTHAVFDGRNLYDIEELKGLGFRYFGIGYGEQI
jgi:UDPglucose 6-dehydrogenase